ncbi:MAG TPA: peptidoglycan-binding domain-containing protein [Stellaceae bacterium]|nr:peptidoglycan-binding domain-containing protein [Stellaceae bacterium]
MYRTLTAAVALAAGLGLAGLAHAQSNAPTNQPMGAPDTTAMSPSGAAGGGTQPQATRNQNMQQASVSQSEIQQAQQQLKAQGLYRGQVDGVNGPQTQQAVMAFQREHGLPETAQLDQQTLSQLNSGGQQPDQQAPTQGMTPSSPAGTQNPAQQNGPTGTAPGGTTNR